MGMEGYTNPYEGLAEMSNGDLQEKAGELNAEQLSFLSGDAQNRLEKVQTALEQSNGEMGADMTGEASAYRDVETGMTADELTLEKSKLQQRIDILKQAMAPKEGEMDM